MGVNACASVQRSGPMSQEHPWRSYLGSATRAPATSEALDSAPRPVWRIDVGRGVAGSPALTEALVVVAQVDRQVALLDRATGDLYWRVRLPTSPGAGPLIDGSRILVATTEAEGRVYALRLENGDRIWSTKAGDVVAPLGLDDSTVYAGTTTGDVLALRVGNGRQVWRAVLPGAVRAAPVPTPAGLVVATATDSLFLLDARTGAVRVRRRLAGSVVGSPAWLDTLVVAGTTGGQIVAFRTDSLSPLWHVDVATAVVGSVALRDGAAWALDAAGALWRVPLADPAMATHVPTGIVSRAGPVPSASGVFVAGVDGTLALIDPATGARRWEARVQAPLEQPPLLDGRFFLAAATRGVIMAFR